MQLDGAGVVVTGGGNGIGAALVRELATRGARVVVNDLDANAAHAVAEEVGGTAAPGDAASEEGVERVIAQAREALGEIDLYCANAGIAPIGGPEAAEGEWERAWQVNVMSHVRAARLLVGPWLERGRGHFLSTVSAAGMLMSLGAAPYSVSKHAAFSFAEWMSATYGHRGITVQCLCPQGVRTDMIENTGRMGELLLKPNALEAEEVARVTVDALGNGQFLILPHAEVAKYYAHRGVDTDHWLAGMRELQKKLD
ncbi:SDR family oxidoreductase [Allokutzneria sp. A3M-2-11 16]|uniref:SDR family oxidoreductase n=1 Tax=Allokutzneria sp. A3M-2-11 16 TaxID=2962043 RepID=UPI0020B6BEAC|nr:SDR family oxidoreductase [Allokutzneria sp. A3M-2-11 16]MCP3802096.1 SDR family oxidoreductase [Allokutzneria sp. A3M-2-11 16]